MNYWTEMDYWAEMDVTTVLFSVVIGLVVIWILQTLYKNRKLPPGPWGIPILGYYPFLGPVAHVTAYELCKRYNSNIVSFRTTGGHLIIILNGPQLIKEVLHTRGDEFTGRPLQNNFLIWVSSGNGIAQDEGEVWKDHRRFFVQTAKEFGIGKVDIEHTIHEEINFLIRDIRQRKGEPYNPNNDVSHAVSCIISPMLFSKRFEKNGEMFRKFTDGFHQIVSSFTDKRTFILGEFVRFIIWFTPEGRKANAARKFLENETQKLIDEHIKTFDEHHLRDYIDCYLYQRKKLERKNALKNSSFTMKRLRSIVFSMFLEGTESTGLAITCLLLELSKHPEEQKKAQKEIDTVVGKNRMLSWSDKQNLPYFDALMLELYRHAQPFFLSVGYSNYNETTIQGYRIPKRSSIMSNFWSINFDEKLFPNPFKFDPSRYLSSDGKRIKVDSPVPFGVGKRTCVGESLAQVEIFLIVAAILQNFNLEYVSEDKIRALPREN